MRKLLVREWNIEYANNGNMFEKKDAAMLDEYNVQSPFVSVGFEEEIEIALDEDFSGDEPELDLDELEQELAEAEKEMALSQAQGNWLDGYLDAMDELEDWEYE